MIKGIESFIALRYLRSRRKEVFISIITVISILGVAVSVMVLNIVLSVMTGFEAELREKLIGANAHIVVRRYSGYIQDNEALIAKIKTVDGVISSFPYTYNQVMLSSDGGSQGLIIRGVANSAEAREKLAKVVSDSSQIDKLFKTVPLTVTRPDGSEDQVLLPPLVVGRSLAQSLGLNASRPVRILSPELSAAPQGLVPRVKRFAVVAAYHSGLVEYESGLAYTGMEYAQDFFQLGDGVSGIEVTIRDVFQSQAMATKIIDALGPEAATQYYATDWTEPNRALWEALKLEKRVYFIVLLLLILVASFSIVSTLVMVVMEKGKDIAILKTMGASDRTIHRVFLLQGAIIGTVGVILGSVLGVIGCIGLREYGFELDESVFSLSKVPVHMHLENFVLVSIAGLLITVAAGFYPAYRAARLRPAEALRFE